MRVGPVLLRNCGPCIRCNTIRMNLDKHCPVDEFEPLSTLSTFRNCPGLGPLFGMYYQMEVLDTEEVYDSVLASYSGYKSFSSAVKENEVTVREADGESYVRVHKEGGMKVRFDKEMDWKKKMKAAEKLTENKK